MQKFGIDQQSYANSSTPLPGLDGSPFEELRKILRELGGAKAPSRLRAASCLLDEAKVFYVDVEGKPSVRIEVSFGDFHSFNLAYHVGTPIKLSGNTEKCSSSTKSLATSLFGNSKPANG